MPKKPTRADLDLELILSALEAGQRKVEQQIASVRAALGEKPARVVAPAAEAPAATPPVRKKHAHHAAPEPVVDKRKSMWTPARRRAMARRVKAQWAARRRAEKKRKA